jgi:hypothetical protein
MKLYRFFIVALSAALLAGCSSTHPPEGAMGPQLVSSSQSTYSGGQYAEVGVQFSSWGDFVSLVSPNRWRSPVSTGGTLSWLNPVAWSEDSGRTGRIFLGQAAVVGGVAIGVVASDSSEGSSDTAGSGGGTGGTTPPPPGPPPPGP